MAFRFFTRKTLFPGVTLNMSKSGPSISVGPRGFRHTIGPRGRRTTVGLPGTGLHYSVQHGKKGRRASSNADDAVTPPPAPQPSVDPAAAQADEDRAFLRAVVKFQGGANLRELRDLEGMAAGDAQWVLGMAALQSGDCAKAASALRAALLAGDLGDLCARNDVSLRVAVPKPQSWPWWRPCKRTAICERPCQS
ncbi:MAG: DUF4236 domain-containing protein [Rhodobacteraceae bacterium]|nr:DUF4236 domain-containing protein [Paracoccaceae bacterium]